MSTVGPRPDDVRAPNVYSVPTSPTDDGSVIHVSQGLSASGAPKKKRKRAGDFTDSPASLSYKRGRSAQPASKHTSRSPKSVQLNVDNEQPRGISSPANLAERVFTPLVDGAAECTIGGVEKTGGDGAINAKYHSIEDNIGERVVDATTTENSLATQPPGTRETRKDVTGEPKGTSEPEALKLLPKGSATLENGPSTISVADTAVANTLQQATDQASQLLFPKSQFPPAAQSSEDLTASDKDLLQDLVRSMKTPDWESSTTRLELVDSEIASLEQSIGTLREQIETLEQQVSVAKAKKIKLQQMEARKKLVSGLLQELRKLTVGSQVST
ncbi:hypothetical protein LTR86_010382 [Recurvomyces mirabilis]|nr:hypothetical protein LTR86_010382 [Recurvomyces mirabilis]